MAGSGMGKAPAGEVLGFWFCLLIDSMAAALCNSDKTNCSCGVRLEAEDGV
jgi:hypothetical protein